MVARASRTGLMGGWPWGASAYIWASSAWKGASKIRWRCSRRKTKSLARRTRRTIVCSAGDKPTAGTQGRGCMGSLLLRLTQFSQPTRSLPPLPSPFPQYLTGALGTAISHGGAARRSPLKGTSSTSQHSQYVNAHAFTFAGIAGSQGYVPVGVIQLSAPRHSWRLTYADVLDGAFLHGTTFHLLYRARGFPSDAAVWAALRRRPDLALLGSDRLPGGGDAGLLPRGTDIPPPFTLSHTIGPSFAPLQL